MSAQKEELLNKLNEITSKPGGKQAARFILNALGTIPLAGGLFAASGNLWNEKEQQQFNETITTWASQTDTDLKAIIDKVDQLMESPSKPKLAMLLGEIIGQSNADSFLKSGGNQIVLMLNNQTLNELSPFIDNGWLSMKPTHSVSSMGAGNKVGNHFEELKRPYGMGTGIILSVNSSFIEK